MAKREFRIAKAGSLFGNRCRTAALLVVAIGMVLMAGGVRADQVVVKETNYPGAKIVAYGEAQLQFRTVAGELKKADLGDVDLIVVDRGEPFNDFNQAEQYLAAGEWENAIVRYKRTLRTAVEFWADLAAARLVQACDRAGRIDEAVLNYIRVLHGAASGPAGAVKLMPRRLPIQRDAAVIRALEHLDAALAADPGLEQKIVLGVLRYDLLRQVEDERAHAAAREIAALEIPESIRGERVFTALYAALEDRMKSDGGPQSGGGPDELAGLDRAIRDCPSNLLASFLLLKGRMLLRKAATPEDYMRAAWPFMRVVAHMPGDARAADGLLGAAEAVEQLGRKEKAVELLKECLAHKRVTDQTKQAAQAALERLQAANATSR